MSSDRSKTNKILQVSGKATSRVHCQPAPTTSSTATATTAAAATAATATAAAAAT